MDRSPLPPAASVYHPLNGSGSGSNEEEDDAGDGIDWENDPDTPSFRLDHCPDAEPRSDDVTHRYVHPEGDSRRTVALSLLLLCTILVWADQNLMAPNLTAMAHEFGLTDLERDQKLGGDIAVAFFLLGAPASWIMGCWADVSHHRVRLLAATIVCGEAACVATYYTTTYQQLYTCRALTGISVGGALPLVYSLLGDFFAAQHRHTANSYVSMGMGVGISLGQGVAGFLGPRYGWRLPFLVIGCPALGAACVLVLCVSDPARGGMEHAVMVPPRHSEPQGHAPRARYTDQIATETDATRTVSRGQPNQSSVELSPLNHYSNERDRLDMHHAPPCENDSSHCNPQPHVTRTAHSLNPCPRVQAALEAVSVPCRQLLSTPTVVLALLQGAPGCIPWGIVNTYLTDFLAVNRGLSVEAATSVLLIFGVGNFLGLLVGGHGGAHLYQHVSPRAPALLAGGMALVACVPFWVVLNGIAVSSPWWMVTLVALAAGLCSGATGPIIKATLQNVTLPSTRGQAFAVLNTFDDLGRGLGPVACAYLIDTLGGRTPAFNVGVLGWFLCGLFNLAVWCTVQRDEQWMQEQWAAAARIESTSRSSIGAETNVHGPLVKDAECSSRAGVPPELWQPTLRVV